MRFIDVSSFISLQGNVLQLLVNLKISSVAFDHLIVFMAAVHLEDMAA